MPIVEINRMRVERGSGQEPLALVVGVNEQWMLAGKMY